MAAIMMLASPVTQGLMGTYHQVKVKVQNFVTSWTYDISHFVTPAWRTRILKLVLRVLRTGVQGKLLCPQDPLFGTRLWHASLCVSLCVSKNGSRAQQVPKLAQRALYMVR